MELNSSAQELLTRAQMLRLSHNSGDLTQEHILLAALSADDEGYLDAEDAAELQAVLSALLTDEAEARAELQSCLNSGSTPAQSNGMAVIAAAGDRAERRNDGVITPALLCEALFESPSPLIRTLMRGDPAATVYEQEDDVTVSEQLPFAGSPISDPGSDDRSGVSEDSGDAAFSDDDEDDDWDEDSEDDEDGDDEDDDDDDDSDITDSDIRRFLSAIAHAMESESVEVKPNSWKKKTKLGWFTFRGGTFAAAVQYFLLCAVLLFGGLLAVELAFGWLNDPPSHLAAFLVEAYIALWVYAALKGASLLLGQISNAFGNFLQTLSHMTLAYMLSASVPEAWALPVWPVWLRAVLSVALFLIECCIELRRLGYVHGDLKPENVGVEVGPDGTRRYVLRDWATLRTMREALFMPAVVGSPYYRAKEADYEGVCDERTEIHSIGMTFLALLPLVKRIVYGPAILLAISPRFFPFVQVRTYEELRSKIAHAPGWFRRLVWLKAAIWKTSIVTRWTVLGATCVVAAGGVMFGCHLYDDYKARHAEVRRVRAQKNDVTGYVRSGIAYYRKGALLEAYQCLKAARSSKCYDPADFKDTDVEGIYEDCRRRVADAFRNGR